MVRRDGMHQEGSRYTGDEWVTEVAAAHRMASEEEESGTQGLKRGNYLNYGVYRHILQVGQEQKTTTAFAVLLSCGAW